MVSRSSSSIDESSSCSVNNMTEATQLSSGSSIDSTSPNNNSQKSAAEAAAAKTSASDTIAATKKSSSSNLSATTSSKQSRQSKKKRSRRSNKFRPKREVVEDKVGAAMARMINESPGFDFGKFQKQQQAMPLQQEAGRKRGRNDGGFAVYSNGGDENENENDDDFRFELDFEDSSLSTFRPLFGPQNRYRMLILTKCFWMLVQNFRVADIPEIVHKLREYLSQPRPNTVEYKNAQQKDERPLFQALRFLVIAVALVLLGCITIATNVAFAAVYALRFGKLVCFLVSSFLVDWKEIASVCPKWLGIIFETLSWFLIQLDRVILFGNRWRGREWNRDGFDFADSFHSNARKNPESVAQYLWKLPPPEALTRSARYVQTVAGTPRNSATPKSESPSNHLRYEEENEWKPTQDGHHWSEATAAHVEAMDYCYIHLREEFIGRQYSKLQKKKSSLKEIVNGSCSNNSDDESKPIPDPREDIVRRASTVSCLENFRQEFVLDPGAKNIDPEEIDEATGISSKLQELLEGDESSDEGDSNYLEGGRTTPVNVTAAKKDGLRRSNSNDTGSIGSRSDGTSTDMNWMDVGTSIGLKVLGSSTVQKAMASHDTFDKISSLKEKIDSHFKKDSTSRNAIDIDFRTPSGGGDSRPQTPFFDADGGMGKFSVSSPGNIEAANTEATGYSESLPVHPMWTSAAAAAASPTHSFTTIETETNGTKGDSTIGSPANSLGLVSPQKPSDDQSFLLSSPTMEQSNLSPKPNELDTIDIRMPKIDVLSVSPTPRQSNKKFAKVTQKLPKIPKALVPKPLRKKQNAEHAGEPSTELIWKEDGDTKGLIPQLALPTPKSRHPMLLPGVKIAVPLIPINPDGPKQRLSSRKRRKDRFQMGTVVSCKRLCVFEKNNMPLSGNRGTNCLAITVNLDKCFLRNGQFATMTIRIMDKWGPRYMPKHSKLPMGSCVATSFGLGVLVGWRVEDDCHIVRSLWQHRGPGSACAYLRRDSIHATMEAAVGFEANTTRGRGTVVGYTNGGPEFKSGRYFVNITEEGPHHKQVMELNRTDVLSCESAKFIPIVEHIRAAAEYQLQIDRYNELCDAKSDDEEISNKIWGEFSRHSDILWRSFLRAIEKDHQFDDEMNDFIQKCVSFLDQLDSPDSAGTPVMKRTNSTDIDGFNADIVITESAKMPLESSSTISAITTGEREKPDHSFWLMNNMFDIFNSKREFEGFDGDLDNPIDVEGIEIQCTPRHETRSDKNYARAFALLRTLTRTVTNAKAASADEPSFKIVLAVIHELLLFVKTVVKVSQKNMNHESLSVWRSAWAETVSVFGPVQKRLKRIGEGIAERMEKHGRRAKVRLLRFVDIIVQDDVLFLALEKAEWTRCFHQFEAAIVQAKIIDEESREHYRKTAKFLYNHFASATSKGDGAAARNNEKLAKFGMMIQWFAAPKKAILELFLQDRVLEMLERIFVRAFSKDEVASRMLNIHCSNFQELRRFRMLKDFTIAGKLWIPLLDAADEEFSWAVSKLPANAQEYLSPISSLFSLCVVQFHKMDEGDLTKDWLNFLMDEEAENIIHDLDMKLILALEQFSRDVRDTMVILPYYPSIEVDILNLVDDINVDAFVKEASVALEDEEMLRKFIREKATLMVERFLDYLPRIAIPVEKRDLGEGWTLTCRGADGGDLTLTELIIKRENLTCQVMGGDSLLFPAASDELENVPTMGSLVLKDGPLSLSMPQSPVKVVHESSILSVIKEIILNAQKDGCYQIGGGIHHPPTDKYAAAALGNLPVSSVLNCAIDLWRNLEIDDDELLEVAIKDVSYQIQLSDGPAANGNNGMLFLENGDLHDTSLSSIQQPLVDQADSWQISNPSASLDDSFGPKGHRFNPRVDPTVLFLEIKKLTFNLENFLFRIEKHESKKTIFDPAFEGTGSILVKNVLIKLRVECYKGYLSKASPTSTKSYRSNVAVPVLQLSDLDVSLEQVKLEVQDTGADWLLNKIVEGFGDKFAEIISANLCEQVRKQVEEVLSNINGYFEENPDVLLGVLDISIDDLDEMTVFV